MAQFSTRSMLLTLAAIAALLVAYFMLAGQGSCWWTSVMIPGSGDPDHMRPAATNFEPMAAEDAAAQPAAVDPVAMSASAAQPPAAHPAGRSQQVVPADLLPQNIERQWLKDSKVQSLTMPSVVAPDFRAGRDTIGQSNKNPNYQIRPDPPITRNVDLGPWNHSVIEQDRPDKSQLAIRASDTSN